MDKMFAINLLDPVQGSPTGEIECISRIYNLKVMLFLVATYLLYSSTVHLISTVLLFCWNPILCEQRKPHHTMGEVVA